MDEDSIRTLPFESLSRRTCGINAVNLENFTSVASRLASDDSVLF